MTSTTVVYDLVTLRSDRGIGHAVKISSVYEKKVGGEEFVGYVAVCGCGEKTPVLPNDTALDIIALGRQL